jgi:hypothetical protein
LAPFMSGSIALVQGVYSTVQYIGGGGGDMVLLLTPIGLYGPMISSSSSFIIL